MISTSPSPHNTRFLIQSLSFFLFHLQILWCQRETRLAAHYKKHKIDPLLLNCRSISKIPLGHHKYVIIYIVLSTLRNPLCGGCESPTLASISSWYLPLLSLQWSSESSCLEKRCHLVANWRLHPVPTNRGHCSRAVSIIPLSYLIFILSFDPYRWAHDIPTTG